LSARTAAQAFSPQVMDVALKRFTGGDLAFSTVRDLAMRRFAVLAPFSLFDVLPRERSTTATIATATSPMTRNAIVEVPIKDPCHYRTLMC
jgi:hypothetical protein